MKRYNLSNMSLWLIMVTVLACVTIVGIMVIIQEVEPTSVKIASEEAYTYPENKPVSEKIAVTSATLPRDFLKFTLDLEYQFNKISGEKFCFLLLVDSKEPDRRNLQCANMVDKKIIFKVPLLDLKTSSLTKVQAILISHNLQQKTNIELRYN